MKYLVTFWGRIKDFIFKKQDTDIAFSNDLLALLRLGCFSTIFLCIINGIILCKVFHNRIFALSLIFLAIAFVSVNVATYLQRRYFLVTLYLYCILVMALLAFLCFLFGTQVGYHLGILCLIFVLFYHTSSGKKYRYGSYIASILIGIYSFLVWFYVINIGSLLPVSTQDNFVLSIVFMAWSCFSMIDIAWFYHFKFTKNEEDLLNYTTKLKDLTKQDALTKLQNRRGIMDGIKKMTKTTTGSMFFVMCDIDFFKNVNDSYGHDIGDKVLARIAEIITESLGDYGFVGRWGGEEFLIVLSHITQQEVLDLMERIRWHVADEVFVITETKTFKVTMTFGIAEHYIGQMDVDESIKAADDNLYVGKNRGRNCVIF